MNNIDVLAQLDECQVDLKKVENIIVSLGQTTSIVPYLTKYAIIKACGTIEVAYKTIVADFCSKRSKSQVKNFIDNKVRDSSRNPTYSNICTLLKEFDDEWNDHLKTLMDSNPDKSSISLSLSSLVSARNDFAHGGNPTMTIHDVIKYYEYGRMVIEMVDEVVN